MSELKSGITTPEKSQITRRGARFIFFIGFVFIVAALSSVVADHYVFPYIATSHWSSKLKILKKGTENVVVVNKTEQVTVSEEKTIADYTSKSVSSVVEIISKKKGTKDIYAGDNKKGKTGSGIIVTADGLIATFGDAIFDSDSEYKVILSDSDAYEARLVSVDPFSNLAFLKIDGVTNLSTASFIAPEDIKVGSRVIVIGKDGSSTQTVFKASLLSELAKNYSINGPIASTEKLQGVFFLDENFQAEKDDGLIGAAVADYNGDVVGILGARKESDGNSPFFVVPINHLQYLIDQILGNGVIKRAKLGAYYVNLTQETSFLSGNKYDRGALIYSPSLQQGLAVISGSPADKAGIKIMDIVLSAGGEEVNPDQNLAYIISKYKPGDEVKLKIVRDGKETEVRVVLQ